MKIIAGVFCIFILLFLFAPVMVLIPMSFGSTDIAEFPPSTYSLDQYRNFLNSRPWLDSVFTSFRIALVTMIVATSLGTMAALGLVRGEFKGKALLSFFLIAPRFVPVIIIALASYAYFAKLRLVGTELGLIIAHTILASPYVIIIVSATLQGFDRSLEKASLALGAGPIKTMFKITLPLIRPGIINAGLFAFMVSFDEIVVAIFISGTKTVTLPKRMWDSLTYQMEPSLPAISTLILLATLLVFAMAAWARRIVSGLNTPKPVKSKTG